jgi:hypothetical protein
MYDGKRAAVLKEAHALRREVGIRPLSLYHTPEINTDQGGGLPSPGDRGRLGSYGGTGSRAAAWTSGAIAAYTELCTLGPLMPYLDGRKESTRKGSSRASIRHVPTTWGVASRRRTQPSEAALLSFISMSEPEAWEAEEAVRARAFLRYSSYLRRQADGKVVRG